MPKPPQTPHSLNLPEKAVVKAPQTPLKPLDWKLRLRVRTYGYTLMCDIWLLKYNGGVTSSLLHGQMLAETAALLVEKLGLEVEYERR